MPLTIIILTYNEARNLPRALASVASLGARVAVVDSGSTDATVEIARNAGADVLTNLFVTQARQFNWALEQMPPDTGWIFRLDADEIVSPELARALSAFVKSDGDGAMGAAVLRRMAFLGRPIRWGGLFPVPIVRVLRHGAGRSEDRWMDEHILVDGPITTLQGELLDDNLKPLTWWIEKHNSYASREVVAILDAEYGFLGRDTSYVPEGQAGVKRWLKEKVYARLPGGLRALVYFIYRYVFRFGFLDGKEGTAFHVLQGFWYRYLVDMKLHEVRVRMYRNDVAAEAAILDVLGINLNTKAYLDSRDTSISSMKRQSQDT